MIESNSVRTDLLLDELDQVSKESIEQIIETTDIRRDRISTAKHLNVAPGIRMPVVNIDTDDRFL